MTLLAVSRLPRFLPTWICLKPTVLNARIRGRSSPRIFVLLPSSSIRTIQSLSGKSLNRLRAIARSLAIKLNGDNGLISATTEFAYVSQFKISDVSDLKCYAFETANIEWLHCIVAHRRNGVFTDIRKQMENYDVIGGKIANDDTNTTITAYMGNVFGQMGSEQADNMCISLLLPERLQDQFCFRSSLAISKLQFIKNEKVSLR